MKIVFIPTIVEAYGILHKLVPAQKEELKQTQQILYPFTDDPTLLTPVYLTGVGKTNTAITCTKVFLSTPVSSAVLLGVAGAYRQSPLTQGDVVAVAQEYFVDEASLFDNTLSLTSEIGFPICPNNTVDLEVSPLIRPYFSENYELIHSNTVSLLSSNDYLAELYSKKTTTQIENMEGASFALTAKKCGVVPIQIRAISNYCGDRNKQDWQLVKALDALANTATEVLQTIITTNNCS